MKILFISPPSENEIIANVPRIVIEEKGHNPQLGILYVASYLKKFSNHEVEILDAAVEKLSYEEVEKIIQLKKPDVVGITVMTFTLIDVLKTIEIIKRVGKEIKVVLGGPHVNLFPEETINLENVDYLVLGEGEEPFTDLMKYIDDKVKLKEMPGLVFKDNGQIINTGARPLIMDLDELPFPARDITPYKKYNSILMRGEAVTTIFTSRGCPYQCAFCDRPHLGKVFRARSAKNVVDEIEECTKMGIKEFLFYDDTFTVNKKRVIDICNDIVDRKLNINWDIRARVDTVNEEVIKHLKKAGCQGIHYGIEAGTDRILKILNKGITVEKAKQVFDLTKRYKIPILAYFMIGNPTETREDIQETFRVIKMLEPDYIHMTILTPFPGTKIFIDGLKQGVIEKDYWREFALNPTLDFVPPHWGEIFTREELYELLIEGYQKFYTRPSYMIKSLLRVRNINELKKKAIAGINVFRMK